SIQLILAVMTEVQSVPSSDAAASGSPEAIREARRRQVFLGDLGPDFLRIAPPAGAPGQRVSMTGGPQYPPVSQFSHQQAFYNVPPNAIGRLIVTVNQAKLAKNYGITRMDPYCRLTVGHHVFETPTAVNGSKNPRWSKSFSVFLLDGVDAINIEIYNEMTFAEDDRIAWTLIQLPARVFQGSTVDDWYPLSGRQGDDKEGMISLVLTLENLPPQPQVQYIPAGGYYPTQHPRPHQQQQQQPVQITDADIGSVQEVFPDTDTEVIKSVLEAHGGNKDAAISALLQMS
ncbi:hypothetical protein BOX15_Mlig020323g1, partial [Macrostomum lignano]